MYMYVSLSQLADAMELMLLSVLSPAVECQWGLTRAEEATITSVSLHAHVLHMYMHVHEQSRIRNTSDIERKKEVAKSKERRKQKKNSQFHKLLYNNLNGLEK